MDISLVKTGEIKIKTKLASLIVKTGERLVSQIESDGKTKEISGPGEYEVGGISILGFPFANIIEVDDLRVAILSNFERKLSDNEINDLGEINFLLISLNNKFALNNVNAIEPNIIIPIDGSTDELNDFVKDSGLPLERMAKVSIKSVDLGENQKIIVLD